MVMRTLTVVLAFAGAFLLGAMFGICIETTPSRTWRR